LARIGTTGTTEVLTINGNIQLDHPLAFFPPATTVPITLNGKISGSSRLINNSFSGFMVLNGDNDFSGGVDMGLAGDIWLAGHDHAFGTGTIFLSLSSSTGSVSVGASGAARTIANPLNFVSGNLNIANSTPITFTGAVNLGGGNSAATDGPWTFTVPAAGAATFSGIFRDGGIVKAGPGTMRITGNNIYTGGTTVNDGTLITATNFSNGTLTVNAGTAQVGAKVSVDDPAGITIIPGMTLAAGAVLDLTNNGMIVDYTGASPLASIKASISAGYAGGTWTGAGITSTSAAAVAADVSNTHKTALGYAEASSVNVSNFAGHAVDSTAVLVRYTLSGDANLDGTVNGLDFNALASNFGGTGRQWFNADFNFDGTVNSLDFNPIAVNFGRTPPFTTSSLGAAVPEPAALALISLAGSTGLAYRRRSKRVR
jgi:autotransporter-associated beta strand protein